MDFQDTSESKETSASKERLEIRDQKDQPVCQDRWVEQERKDQQETWVLRDTPGKTWALDHQDLQDHPDSQGPPCCLHG